MTRRLVRCTACPWSSRRTTTDGPCPDCGAAISWGGPVGRPRGEVQRERMEVQVLPETRAAITPARAAEILDRAAARGRR